MRNVIFSCLFFLIASIANAQSIVPSATMINLAWVDGVYHNPEHYPSWGFFIDAQEETLFGAIYGYDGSDATFVTLQGTIQSANPLVYRGDVYFITDGGTTATDVGNFTWNVRVFEASPSATLTITSNIINIVNLPLRRFSYVEQDKIDILTGADWNITTRVLGISFGQHYAISDDRETVDGIVGALVVDNADTDLIGAAMYVPPGDGDAYGIYIPFSGETDLFAVFNASDTEMFGRYWLLDPGESPSGNGNYFHGAVDTIQASHQTFLNGASSQLMAADAGVLAYEAEQKKLQQKSLYELSGMENTPMFSDNVVQQIWEGSKRLVPQKALPK